METEILYIKNMVCDRCIMMVTGLLHQVGLLSHCVKLGEVVLPGSPDTKTLERFRELLGTVGFELIDNRRALLIEQVKNSIRLLVHRDDCFLTGKLSDYISDRVHHDYTYLSNLFSEVESTTIEKYFIAQRIERVKELLVYDELNLNEIADQLNYSSVAHLSTQFKKITGLTPTHFRKIREERRLPIDKV